MVLDIRSSPPEKIELNLRTTGLFERFENRVFSSYEIGSWKPDPAIFEYAADQMGYKPSESAVIEDSLAGIQAGLKGGFDVFGFSQESNRVAFEQEGAFMFSKMNKLSELLSSK